MVKRLLSLLIVSSMLVFSVCPISTYAQTIDNQDIIADEPVLNAVEKQIISASQIVINDLVESDQKIPQINCIKRMTDFGGDVYYIIELSPIGYLIYHLLSGVFVEISLTSKSPYFEYNENLIYGGPCEYFTRQKNDHYKSLFDGSTVSFSQKELTDIRHRSEAIKIDLVKYKNDTDTSTKSEDGGGGGSGTHTGKRYVSYASYIRSLVTRAEMGYEDGNLCGWIATGITLLYLQRKTGKNLIPGGYITNGKFNGNGFTTHLRDNYGPSDWAYLIKNGITQYATTGNRPIVATIKLGAAMSTTSAVPPLVYNCIQNNQPLILGGKMYSPSGGGNPFYHYVVAYGTSSWGIICHYGWEGYNEVIVHPVFWGDAVLITTR